MKWLPANFDEQFSLLLKLTEYRAQLLKSGEVLPLYLEEHIIAEQLKFHGLAKAGIECYRIKHHCHFKYLSCVLNC